VYEASQRLRIFPHRAFTAAALAFAPALSGAKRLAAPLDQFREVDRGHRLHSRHRLPLRGLALDHVGDLAPRGGVVSAAYLVSGLLALGLFVYLLYALFKPERF
jgi:K+-transporting ATPase KdpF subunit